MPNYVVKPGDTLFSISQQTYGDENLWQEIYRMNRNAIGSDPRILTEGKVIYLSSNPKESMMYLNIQFCTITEPGGLNVRYGPTSLSDLYRPYPQGAVLNFVEIIEDGENVAGNSRWGRSKQWHYFWMGG